MNFSGKIKSFGGLVGREIHSDRWLYAIVAVHAVAATAVLVAGGLFEMEAFWFHVQRWFAINMLIIPGVLFGACAIASSIVNRQWPHRAVKTLLRRRRAGRLVAGLCLSGAVGLFMCFYTMIKTALPKWAGGFSHDALLAELDQLTHFGVNPNNLLAECCADPRVLAVIDPIYSRLWMIFVFCGLFAIASTRALRHMRRRCIGLFLVTWTVGGNLMAYWWLSAGPVYFATITGDGERYRPLADMLTRAQSMGLEMINYQSYLWEAYTRGTVGIGTGISAFPSMHVASVAIIACFMSELGRGAAWAGAIFTAVILFGSLLLGWHYAIDGYYSVALVVLGYRVASAWPVQRRAPAAPMRQPAFE